MALDFLFLFSSIRIAKFRFHEANMLYVFLTTEPGSLTDIIPTKGAFSSREAKYPFEAFSSNCEKFSGQNNVFAWFDNDGVLLNCVL